MIRLLYISSIIGLISSTVYLVLAIVAAVSYRRVRKGATTGTSALPTVSILKPLHGMEPQLQRNLESFFLQDYPGFEIIFGARNVADPALRIVDSLQKKYPNVLVRVVVSGEPTWPNAKVFALDKMMEASSARYIVISDSDVCVETSYLKAVVRPLLDPSVGVVTCLYRGVSAGGVWSRLEALGMSIEMPSGVLVARMLEDMRFALGPTMATRTDVLKDIGGVPALGDYCADDYVLGNFAHSAGKKVVLSEHIIGHVATETSFRASITHQVRWMRSTRFSRRAGHVGTGLTYAMPFGLLGAVAGGLDGNWPAAAAFFAWAYINRVIQAIAIGWCVIRDSGSLRYCWLYPIRDLLGFFVWCASFAGSEIVWRNERYRLVAGGKMIIQPGARERT